MSQYPASPDINGGREIHFPQSPEPVSPPPVLMAPTGFIARKRFSFYGSGGEYFGIWISNLFLTIITLGFYAPWAKVRRLRYFYGHTRVADRVFDFTGIPSKILMGRLIAVGAYFFFVIGGQYSSTISALGFILLFLVIPWLFRATFRFNARNSKYSNSRFYFSGTIGQTYITFLVCGVLILFTMGIMTPYAIWLYKRYQINHLHLGQLDFKLNANVGSFFGAIFIPYLVFIVATIALAAIGGLLAYSGAVNNPMAILVGVAAFYLGIFVLVPLVQARLYKATWNQVSLGNNRFQCNINAWHWSWIVVSNWIARILSLGLLSAWAAVRMYRYKIESLSIHLVNQPDELLSLASRESSAFAEELTDILDIDVSL